VLACSLLLVPVAAAKTLTIQVISVGLSVRTVDRPPKGNSKGDTVVQRDKLLNAVGQFGKRKGARVGSDQGTLTYTSAHTARFRGSATLPDGTITLNGDVQPATSGFIAIPVTGGTGRYAGAKGYLFVAPGEKTVLNVFRLTLAGGQVA
jgi:hypothetical protein